MQGVTAIINPSLLLRSRGPHSLTLRLSLVQVAHSVSDKVASVEGYDSNAPYDVQNVTKARQLLGMNSYRTKEETTRDVLEQYAERGWF